MRGSRTVLREAAGEVPVVYSPPAALVLDVTMKEDACPIYRGDAAQILATVRHMALNMLRAEKGKTASIRRKQKIAAMNSDYLEQVILAGITAANKN